MKKVAPAVGWLIGLAVAALVFFVVGVPVLFGLIYGAVHSGNDYVAAVVTLGAVVGAPLGALWLAGMIKESISRGR